MGYIKRRKTSLSLVRFPSESVKPFCNYGWPWNNNFNNRFDRLYPQCLARKMWVATNERVTRSILFPGEHFQLEHLITSGDCRRCALTAGQRLAGEQRWHEFEAGNRTRQEKCSSSVDVHGHDCCSLDRCFCRSMRVAWFTGRAPTVVSLGYHCQSSEWKWNDALRTK